MALSTPSGLTALAHSSISSQIAIAWNGNNVAGTEYVIETSYDGSSWSMWDQTPHERYILTAESELTTVYFRVYATNGVDPDSAYSNVASATTVAEAATVQYVGSIGFWLRGSHVFDDPGGGNELFMQVPAITVHWNNNSVTFTGSQVTASSYDWRVSYTGAAGTVITDIVDPYADEGIGHRTDATSPIFTKADKTYRKIEFRWKTSTYTFASSTYATDGEYEIRVDGVTVGSATGATIKAFPSDDDYSQQFAFIRLRGDIDSLWCLSTSEFIATGADGMPSNLSDPRLVFYSGFEEGGVSSFATWNTVFDNAFWPSSATASFATPIWRSDTGITDSGFTNWDVDDATAWGGGNTPTASAARLQLDFFTDPEPATPASSAPTVPPMQRAGYVLFSNAIVEKQAEVRLTRSYLQLLAADPPATTAPATLALVEVFGDLYDQAGNNITTGSLFIAPRGPITVSNQLIAPAVVEYPVTGALSINLAPSNGVLYDVEYDPDPTDTVTPRNLKPGYFKSVWDIPAIDVDVANL